ncbi:hypothetical protein [Actinoplanes philippinensis]|uniref:hypothetical protein n=1 Tax=Actinoplanes philippinensis TaxID=35752 RepID=UPI00340E8A5E
MHDNDGDEISTLYVIDGDLTVHGPATFQNWDSNTALYVTGAVSVRDLTCVSHGKLFVGGSLTVENQLFTDLADAGHLVVHGPVSARVWIEAAGRGAIHFPDVPEARLIGGPGNPYFGDTATAEPLDEAVLPDLADRGRLVRAALDHRPLLR